MRDALIELVQDRFNRVRSRWERGPRCDRCNQRRHWCRWCFEWVCPVAERTTHEFDCLKYR